MKIESNKNRNIFLIVFVIIIVIIPLGIGLNYYTNAKEKEEIINTTLNEYNQRLNNIEPIKDEEISDFILEYGEDEEILEVQSRNEKIILINKGINNIEKEGLNSEKIDIDSLLLEIEKYLSIYDTDKKASSVYIELESFQNLMELYSKKDYAELSSRINILNSFEHIEVFDLCNQQLEALLTLKPLEEEAVKRIRAIRNILKDPDSLKVYSITNYTKKTKHIDYQDVDDTLYFEITAMNGFGGTNKTVYSVDKLVKFDEDLIHYYTPIDISLAEYDLEPHKINDDTYFSDDYVIVKSSLGLVSLSEGWEHKKLDLEKIMYNFND